MSDVQLDQVLNDGSPRIEYVNDNKYSLEVKIPDPSNAAKTVTRRVHLLIDWDDIENKPHSNFVGGPTSSTDNALARFDGTTGSLIQNSTAILSDAGKLTLTSEEITGTEGLVFTNSACDLKLYTKSTTRDYAVMETSDGRTLFLQPTGTSSVVVGDSTQTEDLTYKFKVVGVSYFSGQIVNATPDGTAPFDITSKTKVDNLNVDLLDGKHAEELANYNEGIYYVEGTSTTAGTWLGSNERIKEYYDGLMILYKINQAGANTTTLNINGLGAKTVYRFGTTKVTTHFGVNSIIVLSYMADLNGGCWMVLNSYDSTNVDMLRPSYACFYAADAIYDYKICGVDKDGRLRPLTLTEGTGTTKTVNTAAIRPDEFYYYASTTNVDAGALVAPNYMYTSYSHTTFHYTFNSTGDAYREIYLVGTFDAVTGLFTMDTSTATSWYKLVPYNSTITLSNYFTKDKFYILLGRTYSSNNYFALFQNHSMSRFDGTNLVEVVASSLRADDADKLDGEHGSYYLDYDNFFHTPTIGDGKLTLKASDGVTATEKNFTANSTTDVTFEVKHADTSTLEGATTGSKITSVTVDKFGHVTAIGTGTDENSAHSHDAGTGLTVTGGGGISGTVTYAHADTSTLEGTYGPTSDVTQSARQDAEIQVPKITVDGMGHVTNVETVKFTAKDTNTAHTHKAGQGIAISAEGGISGEVEISHVDSGVTAGSYGSAEDATQAARGSVSVVVPHLTVDKMGHITSVENKTITLQDTDTHYTTKMYIGATNVKDNAATTNGNTYLKLYDNSTKRSEFKIAGSGITTVSSDANGNLTIDTPDTNTWVQNTKDADGYVTKGDTNYNKVWKTDWEGNPDWRDVITYRTLTASTTNFLNLNNCIERDVIYYTTDSKVVQILTNAPKTYTAGECYISTVWLGSSNYLVQDFVWKSGTSFEKYSRIKHTSTWGSWVELAYKKDIPTLSVTDTESGNVLTDVTASGHTITLKRGLDVYSKSETYTKDEVNTQIAAATNAAVVLRGTLGTNGTKTALPTPEYKTLGDAYKVVTTAEYVTKGTTKVSAKEGDLFICYTTDDTNYDWILIPSGDEIESWRPIKVNGVEKLGTAISSNPLDLTAGSNVTLTEKDGKVTIASSYVDTGATSVEVTGSGVTVTDASYNATNRKLTLTKGTTYWANIPLASASNDNTEPIFSPKFTVKTSTNQILAPGANWGWASPIAKYLWHDLLPFETATFERSNNGSTWTESTDTQFTQSLTNQKENQIVPIIDDTYTYARFTWDVSWHACQVAWLVLGFTYNNPVATCDITLEAYNRKDSSSPYEWVTNLTANVAGNQTPIWFKVNSNWINTAKIRLTFKRTSSTGKSSLAAIKMLTPRWGNQGQGSEVEKPYEWDNNANLTKRKDTSTLGTTSNYWAGVYADKFVTKNSSNQYVVLGDGTTKALSDFSLDSEITETLKSYLPLAGGTMTGAIVRNYETASNDPVLQIGANNVDARIFRVYDYNTYKNNPGDVGKYGFNLTYNGSGDGVNNSLTLYADNQSAATQVIGWQVNQAGQMGIGAAASTSYRLNVSGSANATTLYESGTSLTNKYVTLATDQTITGSKTFSRAAFGGITIERSGSTNAASIIFKNTNGTLGSIGMTGAINGGLIRWNDTTSTSYTIWDSGNDGAGSGLDADLLDGYHSSHFATADHKHTVEDVTDLSDHYVTLTTAQSITGQKTFVGQHVFKSSAATGSANNTVSGYLFKSSADKYLGKVGINDSGGLGFYGGSALYFRPVSTESSVDTSYGVTMDTNGLYPGSTKMNLGTSTSNWGSLYATTIYEGGTSLATKYAAKDHNHDDVYLKAEIDTLQSVTDRGATTTKAIQTAGLTTTSTLYVTGTTGHREGIRIAPYGDTLSSIWWNASGEKDYSKGQMWGITAYMPTYTTDTTKQNTFRFRGPDSSDATAAVDHMWINTSGLVTSVGGFAKKGSSNSYVLLAAGGTKAVSDFAMKTDLTGGTITSVVAGNGLTGGGSTGEVTLNVGAGNGISVAADAVAVKASNGITVNANGVSVTAYHGITVNTNGVSVKASNGITVDEAGVSVNAGNGITVDTNGVHHADTSSVANVTAVANKFVKTVTFDTYGHVTAITTGTETLNTAGSTNSESKLYLIGTTSQAANPQTYSDAEVYTTGGQLNATEVRVAEKATMKYDSTNECLRFVFA